MELRVALKEEDYSTAARLRWVGWGGGTGLVRCALTRAHACMRRDHPLMRLHLESQQALARGDSELARVLEQQLLAAVSAYESAGAAGSGEE